LVLDRTFGLILEDQTEFWTDLKDKTERLSSLSLIYFIKSPSV